MVEFVHRNVVLVYLLSVFRKYKILPSLYGLQKQKLRKDSEMNSALADSQKLPKLIRSFPQTQPVAHSAVQNKQRLSTNVLAGVSNYDHLQPNFIS